ncbi:MAG: molybdenum cofactor biosynthesis protein MoaE [Alphaproteobacteria bacterium]|nr:molybdenum cofactor biosynthesis protein MoaE [Alphaproteobacteria bacterium]
MAVRVQEAPFDVGAEYARFAVGGGSHGVGAIAMFVGTVRSVDDQPSVNALTLEHYPGMTERMLERIEQDARSRWPLADALIIHRYGRMLPGEGIVLVLTASAHRAAALDACAFLMDYLKTKAPFWKLEETAAGATWVDARDSDDAALTRWTA